MNKKINTFILHGLILLTIYSFLYFNFLVVPVNFFTKKNLFEIFINNWILILVFALAIIGLIYLRRSGEKPNVRFEIITYLISIVLLVGLVLFLGITGISFGQFDWIFILFCFLSTLSIYFGIRRFGFAIWPFFV